MSYKIRNTIALAVIVLLVSGIGGYVTFFYQPKKIKQYNKDAERISMQLQDNTEQLNAIADMQNKLRETLHRWNNRIKEIGTEDISSHTYGYLSDIIDESGGRQLKMNMTLSGSKSGDKYGYNIYKLSGSSEFLNIFRFLWLLENGRKLYKINSITVRSDEVGADTMEFPIINLTYDMEVHSFFTSEIALGLRVMRPDSIPQPVTVNPFQPNILRKTPANVRNLLDVDRISVKATAQGKALIMGDEGKMMTLHVGDEVYLGKVTAIDPKDGSVEFTLNDGGIVITKKKYISFGKKDKGS